MTALASIDQPQWGVASGKARQRPIDLSKGSKGDLGIVERIRGPKRPDGADPNIASLGNGLDGGITRFQAVKDIGCGAVDPAHAGNDIHSSENRKDELQIVGRAFGVPIAHSPDMDAGDRIAARLRRAIDVRDVTQQEVAAAAQISGGGLSVFLARAVQANGKPSTITIPILEKICAFLQVPVWSVVHEDEAVFDVFLSGDQRLSSLATSDPARAMVTAMAIVSESRSQNEPPVRATISKRKAS